MHIYLIQMPFHSGSKKVSIETDPQIRIEQINFPDKVEEKIAVDANYHRERYGFPLSNSEILNFMAHRNAWKHFLDTNESWCLVVENNVKINIVSQEINATIRELPTDWELFFPYDPVEHRAVNHKNNSAELLLNPNLREMRDWEPYLLGFQWGNSIYLINRKGADKLLAIDTIRQRLDDEILTISNAEQLSIYAGEVDWFDYEQVKPAVFKDRNQLIWQAICESSTWTPLRKERVRYLLGVMSEIAESLNIDLVLHEGTHLGYIRHGGIMLWDDDVDIGIADDQLPAYLEQLKKIDGICMCSVSEFHTGTPYYKIWNRDGELIDKYHYTFPFVDLWLFNRKGNDLVFRNGIICPGSAAQDLVEVTFEGAKFKTPYNSIEVLDARYKDWKKKIRVYSWSHCYERHLFTPLSLDIEVDDAGRMMKQYQTS